jgi:hypothetical protein
LKLKRSSLGQESGLHSALKEAAYERLRKEGFRTYVEPSRPPCPEVGWRSRRPDIFATRLGKGLKEFVLIECEAHPSSSSLREKSIKLLLHLWLQTDLTTSVSLNYVLVLPKGTAHSALGFRELWDLWVVDVRQKSVVESIPRIGIPKNAWFPKEPVYNLCKRLRNPSKDLRNPLAPRSRISMHKPLGPWRLGA